MQYEFGSGNLIGMVSAGGILVPRKFGALQDVSIDFDFNLKELYGQYQFPLTIARGQGKITGKAKGANINGGHMNDIFFGQTLTTGRVEGVIGEAGSIPGTPYQITVANGATFKDDYGVTDVSNGMPMLRVPSAPTTGQYSVSVAGVYTFAAVDTTRAVLIDYSFTVSANGNTITINNLLSGSTPQFICALPIKFQAKTWLVRLNACFSKKLAIATKIEDYLVPEFDFMACADISNVIGTVASVE